MAAVAEDIQILFDNQDDTVNSEEASETSTTSSAPVNYHKQAYPATEEPHERGHNTQQDGFVNFKNRDPKKGPDPDKVEGVDNDKYQRLKLPVPFALDRNKLAKLKQDFPGVYFHLKDNGNHDHQFSHVVTMLGTRFLQRRIRPGSRVLDVYGNANACDRFNITQANARDPKSMKALHLRVGPSDFIREVNKWGPYLDEAGDARFHRGTLHDLVVSREIEEYNVLQFIHTLYYQDFGELVAAMHAPCTRPGKRVAYALIHRHAYEKGTLNDEEQTYVKKTHFSGIPLVKQTNVKTNSEYVHRDITPMLFSSDKTWFPSSDATEGITWECHMVNDETWIIEIVPYVLHETREDVVDYNALWDMQEDLEVESGALTPASSTAISLHDDCVVIPTKDGKFIKAQIVNHKLFGVLRQACVGKTRNKDLLDEIVRLAKHHISPSAMFGDKQGLRCPPETVFDHAIAAFFVDLEHEDKLMHTTNSLRPVLAAHASKLNLGPKFREYSVSDILGALRCAVDITKHANMIFRSKDPLDRGLTILGEALT